MAENIQSTNGAGIGPAVTSFNGRGGNITATTSDLTDFASAVNALAVALRLDQFAAPTATVSANSQRISNVGDPFFAADAAKYLNTFTKARWATASTSRTFASTDAGGIVETTSASSVTLTIPPQSSVTWQTGTVIGVLQAGMGTVTIAPGSGVTLNGSSLTTSGQWSSGVLWQRASDNWVFMPTASSSGTVTSVSGTAPIASTGGTTPAISVSPATTGAAGSLGAADKIQLDGLASTYATKAATSNLVDAAGDLLAGSADNTLSKLSVGANGKILSVDTAQSNKLAYIDLPWHVSIDPVRVPAYSTTGGSIAAWATYYQFSNLNDEVVYNIQLGAGTWTFSCWRTIFSSYGILTVSLSGTTIATLDNYSGSSVNPGQSITTGISVTKSDVYALKLKTTSKNASSSGYNQRLWSMDFTRTA